MKAQMNVSVESSTIELLRERAHDVNAQVGDLTDLCIRFALERMPREVLLRWVDTRQNTRGRLRGALTKNERAVELAFDRLKKQPGNELAWKFSHLDIANEAGLRHAVGYDALKALEARGLVHAFSLSAESPVDRWGRPVKSYWSLISAMPEREQARLKRVEGA